VKLFGRTIGGIFLGVDHRVPPGQMVLMEQIDGKWVALEGAENRMHRAGCEKLPPSISEFFTDPNQPRRML
jgi:hypothetical protein